LRPEESELRQGQEGSPAALGPAEFAPLDVRVARAVESDRRLGDRREGDTIRDAVLGSLTLEEVGEDSFEGDHATGPPTLDVAFAELTYRQCAADLGSRFSVSDRLRAASLLLAAARGGRKESNEQERDAPRDGTTLERFGDAVHSPDG
jgi:hypothetical protein